MGPVCPDEADPLDTVGAAESVDPGVETGAPEELDPGTVEMIEEAGATDEPVSEELPTEVPPNE